MCQVRMNGTSSIPKVAASFHSRNNRELEATPQKLVGRSWNFLNKTSKAMHLVISKLSKLKNRPRILVSITIPNSSLQQAPRVPKSVERPCQNVDSTRSVEKRVSGKNFYDFCWTCQLNEFSWLQRSGWELAVNMHSAEVWQHRCMYDCHQRTLQRLKNNDLAHTLLSDLRTVEFLICWVIQRISIPMAPEFELWVRPGRILHL